MILIPTVLSWSILEGNRAALADVTRQTGNASVLTKEGEHIDRAVLLRQIDKGVILRIVDEDRVIFLQWDDVKQLIVSTSRVDLVTRGCGLFNLFCSITDPATRAPEPADRM